MDSVGKRHWHLWGTLTESARKIPATSTTLGSKIKRANYVTYIMDNALIAVPELPHPIDYGSKMKNDCLKPVTSVKDSIPIAT